MSRIHLYLLLRLEEGSEAPHSLSEKHHRDNKDFKREVRRIEADLIEEKSPELKKGCKAAVKKEDNSELNLNLKKILMQLNDRIDSFGEEASSILGHTRCC